MVNWFTGPLTWAFAGYGVVGREGRRRRSLGNIDLVGCRTLPADEGLSADPNRMTG
jgi:hypothetical protein